jgi:hypothetical protein
LRLKMNPRLAEKNRGDYSLQIGNSFAKTAT